MVLVCYCMGVGVRVVECSVGWMGLISSFPFKGCKGFFFIGKIVFFVHAIIVYSIIISIFYCIVCL